MTLTHRWTPVILGFSSPSDCQIPGFLTQQMLSLLQSKFERQISEKDVSSQFPPVSLSRSNSSSAARLTGDPLGTATRCRHYITLARSPQPSKSCIYHGVLSNVSISGQKVKGTVEARVLILHSVNKARLDADKRTTLLNRYSVIAWF